ncbi:MAG: fibronectin type III domain-containing protein [Lachnospiraceae bacterium]|nr:fibronectin type III domain-containing protein [Lachnospiraceae bacterium]
MNKMLKKVVLLMATITIMLSINAICFAGTGKPAKITEIKQIDDSTSQVELSFNKLGADYVSIEIDYGAGNGFEECVDKTSSTERYISGLYAGKTYKVRLRGVNYIGSGNYSYGDYSDVFEVVTAPDKVQDLTQVDATETTAKLQWKASAGATEYKITSDYSGNIVVGRSTTNSFVVTKLDNDFTPGDYYVTAVKKSASGYVAESYKEGYYRTKVVPDAPDNLTISSSLWVDWSDPKNTEGYEVELYKTTSSKVYKKIDQSSSYLSLSSNGIINSKQFYKIRVRGYVTVNGAKKYSKWTGDLYFADELKMSIPTPKSAYSIKVKWTKMKGAKKYEVYASTSRNSGYKKVATVKAKKSSYVIKKIKKKKINIRKNNYYIYVVAVGKFGGKKIKSKSGVWQVYSFL